jgi:hypothetical protein
MTPILTLEQAQDRAAAAMKAAGIPVQPFIDPLIALRVLFAQNPPDALHKAALDAVCALWLVSRGFEVSAEGGTPPPPKGLVVHKA